MLDVSADEAAGAEVVVADPANLQRVLGAVTLAFATDPPSRWLFPQADAYLRHCPADLHPRRAAALPVGSRAPRSVTPDGAQVFAVAGAGRRLRRGPLGQLVEEDIAPEKQADVAAVIVDRRRSPEVPHWYRPSLTVESAWQGRSRGGVLLRFALGVPTRPGRSSATNSVASARRPGPAPASSSTERPPESPQRRESCRRSTARDG